MFENKVKEYDFHGELLFRERCCIITDKNRRKFYGNVDRKRAESAQMLRV